MTGERRDNMAAFSNQQDVKKILFHGSKTILEAISCLNDTSSQILIIVDDAGGNVLYLYVVIRRKEN